MTTREEWLSLAEKCAKAEGPSIGLDLDIGLAAGVSVSLALPHTASLDAITGLIARALPGWAWRVATCHVSDDAWLALDYGDPAHCDRLRAELGEPQKGHWTDDGIDIDRRPPGNPALALCDAFCRVKGRR